MNALLRRRARSAAAVSLLLAATISFGADRAEAQVAYSSNFAAGAGPEWSSAKTEKTPSGVTCLGRFGAESVRLSLPSLPPHTYASVTFDVYAIQGWDGNGATNGPNVFTVSVPGGLTLLQTSFSNTLSHQSYPEAHPYSDYTPRKNAYKSNSLGYATPGDATYRITRAFPHCGDALDIDFAAPGLPSTATWGLDSVRVKVYATLPNSTLCNGDFELPLLNASATYNAPATFTGWTVASGNVMIRKAAKTAGGEQYLDLSATTQGAVQQDVPVFPNQQYDLRFWLAGNPATAPAVKQVQVLWGSAVVDTLSFDTAGHSIQDLGWEPHHYLVSAPSSGSAVRLTFQAVTAGAGGPFLDAVSVSPVAPGDVNDDGATGIDDAVATLRMLASPDGIDPLVRTRADIYPYAGTAGHVHGDGGLSILDLRASLKLGSSGPDSLDLAQAAMTDLYSHFWVGSATTGHVLPTWGGQYNTSFPNGSMWEHAQMLRAIMDLYQITRDPALQKRISSDWSWVMSKFSASTLTSVGAGTNMNWSDDAGWSALMYLDVYRATGNASALADAQNLFNNTCARWMDNTYGGGLWYTDEHLQKSVYQVSQILAGLRLYDITGVASYKDKAVSLYNWVDSHLERGNGLYYVDYNSNGPAKGNSPPKQASSDTMLAGNMAMAVTAARLYRATGDASYLNKAINTANAILAVENDGGGLLLNDRDANVEGFYVGDWAAEVLTLPGIGPEHADMLRRTAASIYAAARTPDGYYSGNWSGPAQGPLAAWASGFMPQQIVVSSNSVHMIVGAAAIGVLQPASARAF
ncbi:MAG TPA: glycoside hydrolase family 76 protein [Armatimonadota bacterium]|jgi:hypothetical protein